MPGVDGLELIKYASEHFPNIQKLVVTGFPSIDGALEVMKSGAVDYITKPFTKDELTTAVLKSLENPVKVARPIKIDKKAVKKSYGEWIGN